MFSIPLKLVTIVALTLHGVSQLIAGETERELVKAVSSQGHLICLYSDKTVTSWSIESCSVDASLTGFINATQPIGLDADEKHVWVFDGSRIKTIVSGAIVETEKVPNLALGAPPKNFFKTNSGFFLIFTDGIVALKSGKKYAVPQLGGQLKVDYLRALCYAAGPSSLWIGTGYGEWGGHLVRFDTAQGSWKWYYDSLHYVTGIALIGDAPELVAWSMSHFSANTILRKHGADAEVVKNFEELDSKYYQAAVYSVYDKVFYAVEQQTIGQIDLSGKFSKIADLPKFHYQSENQAIGVAPGVQSIIPISAGKIIVVLHTESPLLITSGRVQKFVAPAQGSSPR